MNNAQAVKAAEEELDRLMYSLEVNPGVYHNAGMRAIYQNEIDWLLPVVRLAKKAMQEGNDG